MKHTLSIVTACLLPILILFTDRKNRGGRFTFCLLATRLSQQGVSDPGNGTGIKPINFYIMRNIQLFFTIALLSIFSPVQAQDVIQDTRVVGIIAAPASRTEDSIAAKDVNSTVGRVLTQTQRFTVLDAAAWKITQNEIDRQKDAAFIERDIIQKGKSLGATVLVIGSVKNAEIYQQNNQYAARVDYDVKFIDVESSKAIASSSFTGNSEGLANIGSKAGKAATDIARGMFATGKGSWQTLFLTSTAFSAMSATDKNTIMGKVIDAIEKTSSKLNAWIRNTFRINLLCLTVSDADNKRGFQHVLVEGGSNINMGAGDKLKLVLINQMETPRGKILDEVSVADLEVEEVRAETSLCKVLSGGKQISQDLVGKYRVVFKPN